MEEVTREGLWSTARRRVPLMAVDVQAEVLGGHACAVVRQRYRNDEAEPIEAIYAFPLPSGAALTRFSMFCEGRRIEGEVCEREEAFRRYDQAASAGHGAALLEQERQDLFSANVGNLLPGEETSIEIEYVQPLSADEGLLRWALPTVIAPRYIPGSPAGGRAAHGESPPTSRVPDADRISPPVGDGGYELSLDLLIDLGVDVSVSSPSHSIAVRPEGAGRARVQLAERTTQLDRDLVVLIRAAAPAPLFSLSAHRDSDGGYFSIGLVPELLGEREVAPLEVVFVVDTSGSMQGTSIEQARTALRLCLRHLRTGDRFNIIAFESQAKALSQGMLSLDERTLRAADAWVSDLRAGGGTEMLKPLTQAVSLAPSGVILLMTDGQVGNEDEIVASVTSTRQAARIHSFAIGTSASDALLRTLARETAGTVEHIYPGERIDEKIMGQLARATALRVEGLSVRLKGGGGGELSPWPPPPLIDGEPWVMFGRYDAPGASTLELRGTLLGEPFSAELPLLLPEVGSHPPLRKLWAAERIRDLEAAHRDGRQKEVTRRRIVELSVSHGVICKQTAFAVIERRASDRRAQGLAQVRIVPVSLPAGSGFAMPAPGQSVDPSSFDGPRPPGFLMRGAFTGRTSLVWAGRGRPAPAASQSPILRHEGGLRDTPASPGRAAPTMTSTTHVPAKRSPPAEHTDEVHSLLSRQLASGLWDGPSLPAPPGDEPARQVAATVVALRTLLGLGVLTSNRAHGPQIKKAVDALLASFAKVEHRRPLIEVALSVAWLISTGRRTRDRIARAAEALEDGSTLKARLSNEAALTREVLGASLEGLAAS